MKKAKKKKDKKKLTKCWLVAGLLYFFMSLTNGILEGDFGLGILPGFIIGALVGFPIDLLIFYFRNRK